MFRRLALGLALCFLGTEARAANCATVPSCTALSPCDWTLVSTWNCGHVPSRARVDNCIVTPGTSVVLRTDALDCGNMTVGGTWTFDESAAGRDANGYRTFTVGGNIIGNAGGALRMRGGDRLGFATIGGARVFTVNDGFALDVQGHVEETTIAAIADDPPNPIDCGTGAPGREYVISPAGGLPAAHKTGRVVFLSGRARNRHMEIRAVTGGTLSVCTDTMDPISGSDSTGGQRLTPHANRNVFCTAAGKPAACCTGARTGHCPATPISRHSEPAPYGIAACTGSKVPYACCTGPGAGNCTGAIPAVGDRIAIVHDASFFQAGGTNGYRIVGDLISGNDPMPILKAVNIANAGTPTVFTTSAVEFIDKPGVTTPDLEYVNFHDYAPYIDGVRYSDARNWIVRWSAFHDVTPNTQKDTQATLAVASATRSADNVSYIDNVFYRTQGVGPHLNEGGMLPATGCRFLRNLLFDSCLSGLSECGGMQADNCTGGEAAYNVVYDYYAGGNPALIAFTLAMHGIGASMHHNWVVNSGGGPSPLGYTSSTIQGTGVTHNYVSHVVGDGGIGGRYYSNLIRDYGLGQSGLVSGLINPIAAEGNYLLGVERAVQTSPDCTGVNHCGQIGIRYLKYLSNDNRTPTMALDNIVASLASYPGYGQDGRCVEFDGLDLAGGGGIDADWDASVEHLTCDGRSPAVPIKGLSFDQRDAFIDPPVTETGRDLAMLFNNDGPAVTCTTQPGVDEILDNIYSRQTGATVESGGDYAAATDCTSAPGIVRTPALDYRDHERGDYNLPSTSPLRVAGSYPVGSPVGARVFRFNRAAMQSTWATDPLGANDFCAGSGNPSTCCTGFRAGTCGESIVTFDGEFPADVANVDNLDTDGDGVLDLHDNSITQFNPDQLDQDGDLIGAVSDCNDTNAAIYPGAAEVCDGMDDDCNGLIDEAPLGVDSDRDRIAGACDNCPTIANFTQDDFDADGQGDVCDLDDGVIDLSLGGETVAWQPESGYDNFNEYRGDLGVLLSQGLYTQDPALVPAAGRNCHMTLPSVPDTLAPLPGEAFFYLISGVRYGVEGSLGIDSAGVQHPNANPCPP